MKKKKAKPSIEGQTAKVDAIADRLRPKLREPEPAFFAADTIANASGVQTILDRYKWKEVHAPKTWHPTMPGSELAGFYGGRTSRRGSFGQYDVILVHVPVRGSYMVSGTKLMQLVDSAMIEIGHPIRIVWEGHLPLGKSESGEEKRMKLFRVLVAEGDPIDAEDLPRVSQ
jgi:hypothetical protein